jgi:hypothetical protein
MAAGVRYTWLEEELQHAGMVGLLDDATGYNDRGVVDPGSDRRGPAVTGVPDVIDQAVAGERERLWDGVFFGIVLVIPRTKDLGAVISATSFPVEVWNADEHPHQATGLTVTGSDGVTVTQSPSLPAFWPPFASYVETVNVDVEGDPAIDSLVTWIFPGFSGTDCHVVGVRLTVFALSPQWGAGVEELTSWITSVMQSRNGTEQRIGLRAAPDRELGFTALAATAQEAGLVSTRLHSGGMLLFTLPYWPDRIAPSSDVAIGTTVIPVNTTMRDFEVDGLAILWRDSATWEVGRITAVSSSSITLSSATTKAWPAAASLVIPLLPARLVEIPELGHDGIGIFEVPVRFRTEPA